MKSLPVALVFCLVIYTVIADDTTDELRRESEARVVRAKPPKGAPTLSKAIAAKICKPFFVACKETHGKSGASKCFMQFYRGCFQKVYVMLNEMDKCVSGAGGEIGQVTDCINLEAITRR